MAELHLEAYLKYVIGLTGTNTHLDETTKKHQKKFQYGHVFIFGHAYQNKEFNNFIVHPRIENGTKQYQSQRLIGT